MVLEVSLGISLFANIALIATAIYLRRKQLQPQQQKSYDATQLLHDLTIYGQAMVKVERIDPSDIFLRGSRGAR